MKRRAGFTLVELLVVITIIVVLSSLVWASLSLRSSDKMRSAARIGQSAFLGAKDRALYARDLRGVRLIRDTTNPMLVTGFAYLQPLPLQTFTGLQLERLAAVPGVDPALTAPVEFVHAPNGTGWDTFIPQFSPNPGKIRIPSQTGQWRAFVWNPPQFPQYTLAPTNQYLMLQTDFGSFANPMPSTVAYPTTSTYSSCDIQLGNDVLPFHQPIALSSGCVIDLTYSGGAVTTLVSTAAGGNLDVMFSPRGNVSGTLQGLGPLHFLLRDLADATAGINPTNVAQSQKARGDVLVLSVFPQTGLVQTFEVDPTDANADGTIDDLFAFAKRGQSAGR